MYAILWSVHKLKVRNNTKYKHSYKPEHNADRIPLILTFKINKFTTKKVPPPLFVVNLLILKGGTCHSVYLHPFDRRTLIHPTLLFRHLKLIRPSMYSRSNESDN